MVLRSEFENFTRTAAGADSSAWLQIGADAMTVTASASSMRAFDFGVSLPDIN
jgi:hypothetical protein